VVTGWAMAGETRVKEISKGIIGCMKFGIYV